MSSPAPVGLDIAVQAARAAGDILLKAWRDPAPRQVHHKGAIDLVTEVDLAAEAAICEVLERHSPQVPILAEEGGGAWHAPTRWIVDPLDGTTNFVHRLPHFAVSIALEVEGVLEVGCILDPCRDELWTAARGRGARLDGRPIAVSTVADLDDALLATGFPYDRRTRAARYLRLVQAFMERCQGIRRAGAAALDLAWLAGGRLDGFWELGLSPWDVAAGALLVTEAGGRVSALDGGPLLLEAPQVLATNAALHMDMEGVLASLIGSLVPLSEEQGS